MICDSENLPPLVHTPQSQFTSSFSRENVTSRKSVWVIWFLRRNLFRTVTSNKTSCFVCRQFYHQWTDKFRCLLHSNGNCLLIYVEAVLSSSKLSPLFYSWAHLCHMTLYVHPSMGRSWLLFRVICQLSTSHCQTSHSQKSHHQNLDRVLVQNIASVFSNSQPHILKCLWKLITH